MYALKKVVLRANGSVQSIRSSLDEILKEVRLFASIKSSRVVSYMHSWLEVEYSAITKRTIPKNRVSTSYDPDVELISPDVLFCSGSDTSSEDESDTKTSEQNLEKITLYIQM